MKNNIAKLPLKKVTLKDLDEPLLSTVAGAAPTVTCHTVASTNCHTCANPNEI
ncbi:MAG: hypothetical protein WAL56_04485 [Candidatus Sulfotelmatobacter sp.]